MFLFLQKHFLLSFYIVILQYINMIQWELQNLNPLQQNKTKWLTY